jgi:hypothetical protein
MSAIAQPTLQTRITVHRSKGKRRHGHWVPTAKVSAGALAGAATMLLTTILSPHWGNWTQHEMTPPAVTAISTIVTFFVQYLVPERRTYVTQ